MNNSFKIKNVKYTMLFIVIIVCLVILLLMMNVRVYDSILLNSIISCENTCYIEVIDELVDYEFLVIDDNKYDITDVEYLEITMDEIGNYYQKYKIIFDTDSFLENKIYEIELFKNEEKFFNKMLNKMFRKE